MDMLDEDVADNDNIKFQCERDWRRLRDVQTELQNLTPVAVAASSNSDSNDGSVSLVHILHEHEKRLKAELQTLRNRELTTLPESFELQMLILEQDQEKRLDQLQDTFTYLHAKRLEVLDNIKHEEEADSYLKSINDALKKKLAALEQDDSTHQTGRALDSVLAEMNSKLNKVVEAEKYFKNNLKGILTKHFPLSDQNTENIASGSRDNGDMLPLTAIVGMLIEQSLNFPDQPYIDISERFWPPNVEFLLRCQIVVKDPHNSHRMKLVPFHL